MSRFAVSITSLEFLRLQLDSDARTETIETKNKVAVDRIDEDRAVEMIFTRKVVALSSC